jgi:hypothetical protein
MKQLAPVIAFYTPSPHQASSQLYDRRDGQVTG